MTHGAADLHREGQGLGQPSRQVVMGRWGDSGGGWLLYYPIYRWASSKRSTCISASTASPCLSYVTEPPVVSLMHTRGAYCCVSFWGSVFLALLERPTCCAETPQRRPPCWTPSATFDTFRP